jgi:hypothetical protein
MSVPRFNFCLMTIRTITKKTFQDSASLTQSRHKQLRLSRRGAIHSGFSRQLLAHSERVQHREQALLKRITNDRTTSVAQDKTGEPCSSASRATDKQALLERISNDRTRRALLKRCGL